VSLTQTNHVFASVTEQGLNTLLHATFTARPRYLNYGSSLFVKTTSVLATNMQPIPFPGVPGGIQWAVRFTIPTIDLFPPDAKSSTLPPGANQFTIKTSVTLTLGCMTFSAAPDNPTVQVSVNPIAFSLDVWARGELATTNAVVLQIDQVRMPQVLPGGLEQVLDCLIRMILQAAVSDAALPLTAISVGAFQLILQRGPLIDADQAEAWGDI
jgi:hypothetical protein